MYHKQILIINVCILNSFKEIQLVLLSINFFIFIRYFRGWTIACMTEGLLEK